MKTKINCVVCPTCKDEIYSRARHDYHHCSCGEVAVDGGFDYLRLAYKTSRPTVIVKTVDAFRDELYQDWNHQKDIYGVIKPLTTTNISSTVNTEFGNNKNKKDITMPTKKKTAKKTDTVKTPKAAVVETVSDPEKGSSVRVRCSGL